jgi:tRNA-splicing ligase RtcB
MSFILKQPDGSVPIELWTPITEVESAALDQLKNVAKLPWAFHHVAVMPDVHYGKGATVGSVIAMKNAVSPAAVGVDIGCGMGAIRTSLRAKDLPDNLDALRADIEAAIPVGFNSHDEPAFGGGSIEGIKRDGAKLFSEFGDLTTKVQDLLGKAKRQVGTLGGGNHFIEICLDDGKCDDGCDVCHCGDSITGGWHDNHSPVPACYHGHSAGFDKEQYALDHESRVWLMLHSGSRNIGKELAEFHINIAKKLAHNQDLPDKDLSVFLSGTPEMAAYRHDLMWAQRYAFLNRRVMLEILKGVVGMHFNRIDFGGEDKVEFDEPILCHHNYVSEETHFGEDLIVTRKGAISAKRGELGIIPGSMGTKSYIVKGLGNKQSFTSASHGAGRRMSRGKAKRTFTIEDFAAQTAGVNCNKSGAFIDEIPGAYKDIDQVMKNQSDLVEVLATLKQCLCVKG